MTDYVRAQAVGFVFPKDPHEGTTIFIRGQRNYFLRSQPHIRADGEPSRVLVWQSDCCGCNRRFEQTTPTAFSSFNRRCRPCIDEGVVVRRKSRYKGA